MLLLKQVLGEISVKRSRHLAMSILLAVFVGAMGGSCAASQELNAICTVSVGIDPERQSSFAEDIEGYAANNGLEYVLRLEPRTRPTHRYGLRNRRVEITGLNSFADEEFEFFFYAIDDSAEAEANRACQGFRTFIGTLAYAQTRPGAADSGPVGNVR